MTDSIPDYYRHLAEQRAASNAERDAPSSQPAEDAVDADREPPVPYRANAFRMMLPSDAWTDRSLYTLTGPTIDGIQHNITVNVVQDPEAEDLDAFVDEQLESLEAALDDCRVLMTDPAELACGLPAHRAIYVWRPNEALRLYQEQIYMMEDGCAYVLTSSFTQKTRKQIGAAVEQMMLSFTPRAYASEASPSRAPQV